MTCLQGSYETEQFTRIMNKTLNALNRKYPAEGIRKNGANIEVQISIYIL